VQYFTSSFILALIRWCEKKSTAAAAGEKYKKEKKRRGLLSLAGHTQEKWGERHDTHRRQARANNIVYVCPYGGWVAAALSRFLARWYLKRVERGCKIYTRRCAVAQNIAAARYLSRSLCTTGDDAEEETDAAHCAREKKGNNPVCVLGMMHSTPNKRRVMILFTPSITKSGLFLVWGDVK
jgi:hypothetical protein